MANDLITALLGPLTARAGNRCELCSSERDLSSVAVPPSDYPHLERALLVCPECTAGLDADSLEGPHWFCLRDSAWSEVPAVQVVTYRLLHLISDSWASELLDQMYLDDETMAWAQHGVRDESHQPTRDCNGAVLSNGDSVTLIKDLDVKGANFTAKRGLLVKNIRLGDDPELIEGRVHGTAIFLKTAFIKRA
jgi:protein PhnA